MFELSRAQALASGGETSAAAELGSCCRARVFEITATLWFATNRLFRRINISKTMSLSKKLVRVALVLFLSSLSPLADPVCVCR